MLQLPPLFIKFVKAITLGTLLIFLILIFLHTDSAITQDLGRHLTLGKIIWEKRFIPTTNYFSYTNPDFPVINHHWGSQVIFYLLDQVVKVEGMIIIKVIILTIAVSLLVIFTIKKANYSLTMAVAILSLEIFRERTEIRPEIFAYILYTLLLIILYRAKEKRNYWIFLIPILAFLWINLHVSFVMLAAIFFLFLIDRFLNKKINSRYLFTGILIIAALLFNPFGIKGLVYPLQIFNNYGYTVAENQTPFFLEKISSDPTIFYFKITGLLLLLTAPFLLAKKYFFEVSSAVLTGIMSATAIRHFPFFALALIYPLSLGLTIIKDKLQNMLKIDKASLQWAGVIFNFILIALLIWEIHSLASNSFYLSHFSPVRTGTGQVESLRETLNYMEKNKITGPIFNNFDYGSYLIFRLYPNEKVFVDGRPEAYPVAFFREVYIPMQEREEIWRIMEEKYQFKTIIYGHTEKTSWGNQFLSNISKNNNWQIVYFDDWGIILIKKEENFRTRLQNNIPLDIKNRGLKLLQEAKDPDELMRLGHLFNLIGQSDLENLAFIKINSIIR